MIKTKKIYIPNVVFSHISKTINAGINKTNKQISNLWGNENHITSALLTNIATDDWLEVDGLKYRITYSGPMNSGELREDETGADGIIQIEIKDASDRIIQSKCMIFQAKKIKRVSEELDDQISKMNNFRKFKNNGSAVIIYDEERGIFGMPAKDTKSNTIKKEYYENPIGDLLTKKFLTCKIGILGENYNPKEKKFKEFLNIEVKMNSGSASKQSCKLPKKISKKPRIISNRGKTT